MVPCGPVLRACRNGCHGAGAHQCWGQAGDCAPRICRAVFVRGVGQAGGLCGRPVPAPCRGGAQEDGRQGHGGGVRHGLPRQPHRNDRAGQGRSGVRFHHQQCRAPPEGGFHGAPLHHGRTLADQGLQLHGSPGGLAGQNPCFDARHHAPQGRDASQSRAPDGYQDRGGARPCPWRGNGREG